MKTRSRRIPSGQLSTGAPYDVAVDDRGSISVLFQGWLGDDRPSLWLRTWRAKGGLTLRERCGSDARRLTGPPTLRRVH